MKKLGAIVTSWNTERYIVPHLRMLETGAHRIIVLQGTEPIPEYERDFQLGTTPDASEDFIRKYFPNVEIVKARTNKFEADLYNQGLELLTDCDLVMKLDADMFLTKIDWARLLTLFHKTDYDAYHLDYSACVIDYYYDLKHGIKEGVELDVIAAKPTGKFHNIVEYESKNKYMIAWEDFNIHHLRGWKGKANSLEWINSQKKDWIEAPFEIKEMLYT